MVLVEGIIGSRTKTPQPPYLLAGQPVHCQGVRYGP